MDAVEFFQAIEKGAEYRVPDIDRLIEDEYERENAKIMFGDFVSASGKIHLLTPPGGGGGGLTGDGYNPNQPRDRRGRWTKVGSMTNAELDAEHEWLFSKMEARGAFTGEKNRRLNEIEAEQMRRDRLKQEQFRSMTTAELEAEADAIHALLESGGAPPAGTYERLNQVSEEIGRRRKEQAQSHRGLAIEYSDQYGSTSSVAIWARENYQRVLAGQEPEEMPQAIREWIDRFEGIGNLSDDEIAAQIEELHNEVPNADSNRILRRLEGEQTRRRVEIQREIRSRAITEAGRRAPDFTNMEASEIQEYMNAAPRRVEGDDFEGNVALELSRMARREMEIRSTVATIGRENDNSLSRLLSSDDPRLVEAATAEHNRRQEARAPIIAAINSDFESAKSMILKEKGFENDWDAYADARWNPVMSRLQNQGVTPEDVMKPFMPQLFFTENPTGPDIQLRDSGEGFEISIRGEGRRVVNRTFFEGEDGSLVVVHDLFRLNNSDQGNGTSRELMRQSLDLYHRIGVDRIDVHANIDAGGYVWARYGFVPTYGSWDDLRNDLAERVYSTYENPQAEVSSAFWAALNSGDPKAVWAIADSPEGKEMLQNTDWYGELDMHDMEAVKRFSDYANKGKK